VNRRWSLGGASSSKTAADELGADSVSNLKKTETGFTASVDIPTDDDGFFGRECSTCNRFFKRRFDHWQALSSGGAVTCPYCGAQSADPNDFLTAQQQERAMSALKSMAEQYAHEALRDVFRGLQGRSRSSAVRFTINETPPPVRSVTTYVEEKCGGRSTARAARPPMPSMARPPSAQSAARVPPLPTFSIRSSVNAVHYGSKTSSHPICVNRHGQTVFRRDRRQRRQGDRDAVRGLHARPVHRARR
jgi:hypothetical protein